MCIARRSRDIDPDAETGTGLACKIDGKKIARDINVEPELSPHLVVYDVTRSFNSTQGFWPVSN